MGLSVHAFGRYGVAVPGGRADRAACGTGADGDTGGTGSAGAGNQYVELKIGATTYKILHDGTV